MEFRTRDQLIGVATIADSPNVVLTRGERLERWAELLAQRPEQRLRTLGDIEFRPASERLAMRADGSLLTIAFADPHLRGAGLASDTLGDAQSFFSLSDAQIHRLMCSCMHGASVTGGATAARLRRMAKHPPNQSVLGWMSAVLASAVRPLVARVRG